MCSNGEKHNNCIYCPLYTHAHDIPNIGSIQNETLYGKQNRGDPQKVICMGVCGPFDKEQRPEARGAQGQYSGPIGDLMPGLSIGWNWTTQICRDDHDVIPLFFRSPVVPHEKWLTFDQSAKTYITYKFRNILKIFFKLFRTSWKRVVPKIQSHKLFGSIECCIPVCNSNTGIFCACATNNLDQWLDDSSVRGVLNMSTPPGLRESDRESRCNSGMVLIASQDVLFDKERVMRRTPRWNGW